MIDCWCSVSVSVLILSVPGVRGVAEHARCEEVRVAVPDPGHLQVDTVGTVAMC